MDIPFGFNLEGRAAIVTGAGAAEDGIGNGRAAAILLAKAGCRVLVVDRDRARAEATATMIESEDGTAEALQADVTVEAECRQVIEVAPEAFGR
ncbi:MAG: SDR family NAD(P)-dependent oxidoreductase, partial [Pseudomonadales bacterium]|nr:SDR family NAD(P)-dependent oxidoreductase [Pseudomonadales bacterium]